MRYLRFVVDQLDPDSGVAAGIFTVAYELRDSSNVVAADRHLLAEQLAWFENNLPRPTRLNRTTSKGFYRRRTRGIAWFKDTATEHVARMHQIKAVLERYGHAVAMITEARVGYVVHDDAYQVIAEPFNRRARASGREVSRASRRRSRT